MRKHLLVAVSVLALVSVAAYAQEAPKPLDQRVEQAQAKLYAAQSDYYGAVARKFQADLIEARKREADTAAWWGAWWKGMFPGGAAK